MENHIEYFEKAQFTLTGLVGILFDRFIDMSEQKVDASEKLYLAEKNQVVFPSENIYGFLCTEKPAGCARWFEGRKGPKFGKAVMSYTGISPEMIPFRRNGKEIFFSGFKNEYDAKAKIRVLHHKATVMKNSRPVPMPTARPMLEVPWQLEFTISLVKNNILSMNKIIKWFEQGGIEIGLGAYRPRFGRFMVEVNIL